MNQKGFIVIPALIWWVLGAVVLTGIVIVEKKVISFEYPAKTQETTVNLPTPNPSILPLPTPTPTSVPTLVIQHTSTPAIRTQSKTENPKLSTLPLNGNNIFYFINDYRLKNGIPQLSQSEQLCQLAQERANFLVKEDPSGQKSSIGRHYMFEEFIQSKNITFSLGENQYGTTHSGDVQVIEGWKKSPPHNQLMLATEYKGDTYTRGCVRVASNGHDSVIIFLIGGK